MTFYAFRLLSLVVQLYWVLLPPIRWLAQRVGMAPEHLRALLWELWVVLAVCTWLMYTR